MNAAEIRCPACGAVNRAGAVDCRLCGAVLRAEHARAPRLQQKILRRTDFLAAARANQGRTRKLIAVLLLIGTGLGYLVGWNLQLVMQPETPQPWSGWGVAGALLLLGVGSVWSAVALRSGDRLVLRLAGARAVGRDEEPQLHNVVEEMAIAAGVPKPQVYLIETDALNAFATGMEPRSAAIAVTRGLLRALTREELQGVVGHEMGHVVNWDIRYATAVAVLVGLIALVSDAALRSLRFGPRRGGGRRGSGGLPAFLLLLVLALLAPIAARLVQMAVSRQREFLADATSARLTRNPLGLIGALEKLDASEVPFAGANRATQHLFIVNPVRSFGERASALLATHPPIARRIERLRNLGAD